MFPVEDRQERLKEETLKRWLERGIWVGGGERFHADRHEDVEGALWVSARSHCGRSAMAFTSRGRGGLWGESL